MRQTLLLLCAAGLAGCGNLGIDSDSGTSTSTTAETGDTASTTTPPTTTFDLECTPGQQRCADDNTREVCKATGFAWEPQACTQYQKCSETGEPTVAACLGPCETTAETSIGCEFLAIRMRSNNSFADEADADAIIVGNTDMSKPAEVQVFLIPQDFALEQNPISDPITLAPGESHIFKLTNDPLYRTSSYRTGGVYRVVSDYPISAYLHSPLTNSDSNDASLLLPVKALGTDYVVASYAPYAKAVNTDTNNGRPSYFNVIATEDDTEIVWLPKRATYGEGITLYSVAAGAESQKLKMDRFDVIQIGALSDPNDKPDAVQPDPDFKTHDVSGTIIHANKPIVVMGGTACASVPFTSAGGCNHLQEQMLPVKYWGKTYIAPHAPTRGDDTQYFWRVYGTKNNQQIALEPSPGTGSITIGSAGGFKDVVVAADANFQSFTFKSTAPFMPVQLIGGGKDVAKKIGDPAMYQTIPVEQHLRRYVFVTGAKYTENYAQVVRKNKGAEVFINGAQVDGWYLINATGGLQYQVADVPLDPGDPKVYIAESDDPFGVNVIGYVTNSAYAYPAGMGLKVINPDGGN